MADAADVPAPSAVLRSLPGVGPAREEKLARLGVATMRDLLLLIPRRLEQWEGVRPVAEVRELEDGATATVSGRVLRRSFLHTGRRRSVLRVRVQDETGEIDALFFNQPWLRDRFDKGTSLEVHGRIARKKDVLLSVLRLGTESRPLPEAGSLTAVYPSTDGLSPDLVGGLCRAASERHADELGESLAPGVLAELELQPLPAAVRALHQPPSVAVFESARRRVAFEPILGLQARLVERRRLREEGSARAIEVDAALHEQLLGHLPHVPTDAQRAAIHDLRRDLARRVPMRRLLQGDVGSGKTLVGLYACLAAAARGTQAAFMAPTELLAEQHAAGLRSALEAAGLRAGLLTGSLPAGERRALAQRTAAGEVDLVFGTHALFSEDVQFAALGLVVIDEQHRFGVAQRQRLLDKGSDVHGLLMTATPIPRSLAMTVYGDLDLTLLSGRPPGRGEVRTRWVREAERGSLQEILGAHLDAGERVYWVVPRIEEGESGAAGAERRYAQLSVHPLARAGIELVHGRIPAEERAARLERFRRGDAGLLVATTVIEVGVDVPEATVMVIECAERLGLAQLHQLRGRVGRGPRPSLCLLLGKESAADRFELLEATSDGFEIADEDLRRRGMGDLAGVRQAGDAAEGSFDPERDLDLILFARDLVARDPEVRARYAHTFATEL